MLSYRRCEFKHARIGLKVWAVDSNCGTARPPMLCNGGIKHEHDPDSLRRFLPSSTLHGVFPTVSAILNCIFTIHLTVQQSLTRQGFSQNESGWLPADTQMLKFGILCSVCKAISHSHSSGLFNLGSELLSSRIFGTTNVIVKYNSCIRYSCMAGQTLESLPNGNTDMHSDTRRTYQVVVAATQSLGIGKDGKLPWRLPSDLKFFKEVTMTTSDPTKKNAVIMGRKTWESIPSEHRPLPGRLNVVLTRSGSFGIATTENVVTCGSLTSALELLGASPYSLSIERVFVIGGGHIFREALSAPGCEAIHITEIETSIDCDTSIPPIDFSQFHPWYSSFPMVENNIRYSFVTYVRMRSSATESLDKSNGVTFNGGSGSHKFEAEKFSFLPKMIFERHEEYIYLRLVQDIISNGIQKDDRTGTGTLSKFGCQMRFNLRKSFPLLTTKKVFWRGVVEELLWFISGSTNAKVLQEKGVHKWDGNASREYLGSIGLVDREEGDLGPIYGFKWRHFCARYTNMHADYAGQGFDQLLDVVDKIKNNADDQRIFLSAWNPSDLVMMALPPCHMFAQVLKINPDKKDMDSFLAADFKLIGYDPHQKIDMKMAV